MEITMPISTVPGGWNLDHSYSNLPPCFFARVDPSPVQKPKLVVLNRALATTLGMDPEALANEPDLFSGNRLPTGARPLAQAYSGHQFGNFTHLGDGRALLLGEQLTPEGNRFDIQLKGSGPTPFSRRGDGRAALGPMLREYIISEAMHALGIPTTRSLAVVETGEQVIRQEILPGAVLTRVASSHIRVGTFEWAAARGDETALRALADYTIRRHFPEAAHASEPYLAFFDSVMESQAALIAQWMRVGFIHGVMNTDNMALSGETIDYGPCAFMDAYDPGTVFSSIDSRGRYAYGNQPLIAQWNLARLAEALLPLLHAEEALAIEIANERIEGFASRYQQHWLRVMRKKLGLFTEEADDGPLIHSLLEWMRKTGADFTNTFRDLGASSLNDPEHQDWLARWHSRLNRQPQAPAEIHEEMIRQNPAVIPRNHRVEEALSAASQEDDLEVMHALVRVLARPYDRGNIPEAYTEPSSIPGYRTFCGT